MPSKLLVVTFSPLGKTALATWPTAVMRSRNVRVRPSNTEGNRFPLVWTRPPKSKSSPPKNVRSVSENTPNWNTGTAMVFRMRRRRTSDLPVFDRAVTVIGYSVTMPLNPWYGPLVMLLPRGSFGAGLPLTSGVNVKV